MKLIKLILICFSILVSFTVVTGCQTAQKASEAPIQKADQRTLETIVKIVKTGCETELKSYCSQVTPGRGRIIACLYGHQDKLSRRCEYAVYDAAAKLEQFIHGLSYAALECEDDIEQYCGTEIPGKGRILKCLVEENEEVVSKRCKQVIKDVGLEVELMQ